MALLLRLNVLLVDFSYDLRVKCNTCNWLNLNYFKADLHPKTSLRVPTLDSRFARPGHICERENMCHCEWWIVNIIWHSITTCGLRVPWKILIWSLTGSRGIKMWLWQNGTKFKRTYRRLNAHSDESSLSSSSMPSSSSSSSSLLWMIFLLFLLSLLPLAFVCFLARRFDDSASCKAFLRRDPSWLRCLAFSFK